MRQSTESRRNLNRRQFAVGGGALAGLAAASPGLASTEALPGVSRAARDLHRRAVVVDCNLGPPLEGEIPQSRKALDVARNSGVTAVKSSMGGFNNSFEDTISEISFFQRVIEAHPQYYRQIRSVEDFAGAKRARQTGVIFSFESVTALGEEIDRIDLFRGFGVRVMQLSYNTVSPFGAGVLAPADASLTELGRKAIARMNESGVALDLSHSNPATTGAAMSASKKPVLITHAGCTAIHPHPRNKSDEQLRALANKGGVVGIYDLFYLTASPRQPTLEDYLAHMAHALKVCGEDHVGIGSDTSFDAFDVSAESRAAFAKAQDERRAAGVAAPEEDRLPYVEGLNRADRALIIADGLLKLGYTARVAEKVLGANFVRAFSEIW